MPPSSVNVRDSTTTDGVEYQRIELLTLHPFKDQSFFTHMGAYL